MIEFEKKHKRGKNTFIYTLVHESWWLILLGIGFMYVSWSMVYGQLSAPTSHFLNAHADWYVTNSLLALWIFLFGISWLFVAYLLANVHYRYYRFILDDFALHLHRGLFFIRETTIPYHQITNVHIERPYYYRMYGVAQIDVVTAADKGMDKYENKTKKFLIPVIDARIARQLSRQLLECAAKTRNGDPVYEKESDDDDDDEYEEEEFEEDEFEEVESKTVYRNKNSR